MTPYLELHDIDVAAFLAVLDTCVGNVYLVTEEGDKLNLKSKLCQLVGLQKLIEGGIISNATLVCDNIKDEEILVKYKLYKVIED